MDTYGALNPPHTQYTFPAHMATYTNSDQVPGYKISLKYWRINIHSLYYLSEMKSETNNEKILFF